MQEGEYVIALRQVGRQPGAGLLDGLPIGLAGNVQQVGLGQQLRQAGQHSTVDGLRALAAAGDQQYRLAFGQAEMSAGGGALPGG